MITVFTPTYNRAYILPMLYESLKGQTYRDFEWIVVDDGSTDDTQLLLGKWQAEAPFKMRCFRQENGGKHRAINRGVKEARGEWFFIVDSDDRLPIDSLELVAHYTDQIADNDAFAGVSGSRCYPDGKKVGGDVDYDVVDTDCVSIRTRLHVKGDMAEVWRTSVLKEIPFPEFEGEKFMSEGIVWAEIAKRYKLRYFARNIYTCDYLADGLTRNLRRHHRNSPRGSMLLYSRIMRDRRYSLKSRITAAINYWRYTPHIKYSERKPYPPTWWAWLMKPAGWMFYKMDVRKKNATSKR